MSLEDHVGDIIHKARIDGGHSLEAVAREAGLTADELAVFEVSGSARRQPDYRAVASLLGLHAAKLAAVASGWEPAQVDLGVWRELRQVANSSGGFAVNCYLVWDEVSREAALFDTGFDDAAIVALVRENGLQLRHVFLTHGHGDHAGALGSIRGHFPKARVHSGAKDAPVDERNRPNDFIHLGSLRITNRQTPGHTEDGATYIVGNWPEDAPHVAFVGDALFAGSMGKAPGRGAAARKVVLDQILSLPPAALICPGHGPLTTVREERESNPFF